MADAWLRCWDAKYHYSFWRVTYLHTFGRYTDAGREAREARIHGGMHYDFSNNAGAHIGRQVVSWMFARGYFRRIHD
jgi:hypothetical protein